MIIKSRVCLKSLYIELVLIFYIYAFIGCMVVSPNQVQPGSSIAENESTFLAFLSPLTAYDSQTYSL